MPQTIREQIANSLRGRILARLLPEGSRLKEENLAKEFGVSRGPIRDVFLELTKEGYLKALPNRGASVSRAPDPRARKLYLKTRRDLESLALRHGFSSWGESDLPDLKHILRQFRLAAEENDLPTVIEWDLAFHRFIVERYPASELKVLWSPLMVSLSMPYSRHHDLMESYHEHARIVECLDSGDLCEAVRLLKANIQ